MVRGLGKRIAKRLTGEVGLALPLALSTMFVLGATTTTVLGYTTSNAGSAARSNADVKALALAEAGLNYAFATLYGSSTPTMPSAVPSRTVTLEGGDATYYGTLSGSTWTLVGVGTVHGPTVGSADVVRSTSGRATLGTAQHGASNNAVWNYVYADATTGCTSLSNSVVVNVPLYVRGNLCLSNTASVTGYQLQVGGNLTLTNSATIGTAGSPIHDAHIGGSCSVNGVVGSCGPMTRVYAEEPVDHSPAGLTKPPLDLADWYRDSQPGPMHACTTGSFPGGFDNDALLNHSRGTVNLAPSTAYDCEVRDGAGTLIGRIAWSPSTQILTIAGTIFFDGDISFANNTNVLYQGRGTIYTSGVLSMSNQTTICGVVGCGDDWDTSQNLLAFVAGGLSGTGGSTASTSISIGNYSTVQGAFYAATDYIESNNSTVWGPIIARQVYLANSTSNHYVPIGTLMPGMPATYEDVITVANEPGSFR